MSEYSTDQILEMIEKLGGPEKLDLSGKDLSGIDLSTETIQQKYKERGWPKDGKDPPWYSSLTQGIDLHGSNLRRADLAGAKLQRAVLAEAKLNKALLTEANF